MAGEAVLHSIRRNEQSGTIAIDRNEENSRQHFVVSERRRARAPGMSSSSLMCPARKQRQSWSPLCLTWPSRSGSDEVAAAAKCCNKPAAKRKRDAAALMVGARSSLAFAAVAALALANCWFFLSLSPSRQALPPPPSPVSTPPANNASFAEANSSPPDTPNSTDPPQEVDQPPAPESSIIDPIADIGSPGLQISESEEGECDVSAGAWISEPGRTPLYTNETCAYIQPSQNCMMNGRPDRRYLDWRWKPHGCELRDLDPGLFLETMRGKKMVFIGDSIARNHMQSLLCALAQVEEPEVVFFDTDDKVMKWGFPKHDFLLGQLWSPFLAQHDFVDEIYHIHLDVPEAVWQSEIHDYDVAILSSGYWYFRPSVYYSNNTLLGCNPRAHLNLTIFEVLPAYRLAHQNMLRFMSANFRGLTILRTITVDHFEYGSWNTGGLCNRTDPFDPEPGLELPWMSNEMYMTQAEEFARVVGEGGGVSRLALLNVTWSAFLRPDGHPNTYRVQPANERPQNDCLHWCLPGPIDTWNQLLFRILEGKMKREVDVKLTQFNKVRGKG